MIWMRVLRALLLYAAAALIILLGGLAAVTSVPRRPQATARQTSAPQLCTMDGGLYSQGATVVKDGEHWRRDRSQWVPEASSYRR